MIQQMLAIYLWFLCLFKIHIEHLKVLGHILLKPGLENFEHYQSCPTLCDPIDSSPPGSPVPGILQARILEWVDIPFSRASSQPRDQTRVSCIEGRFFNIWATRRAPLAQLIEPKIENFKIEILQANLQKYMNRELRDVQADFRKGRGTRDKLPTSAGSSKKQESSRKTSISSLLIMPKLWMCGS